MASAQPMNSDQGLSPLARGNRILRLLLGSAAGPIPARAGQPLGRTRRSAALGAYPRSRGATTLDCAQGVAVAGLSPLARGNLDRAAVAGSRLGPIPARAGQPLRLLLGCCIRRAYPRSRGATCAWCPRSAATRAYPRSRGATDSGQQGINCAVGLSPLARGNLYRTPRPKAEPGPIPARAGQPSCADVCKKVYRAYPRSRGATKVTMKKKALPNGLSPLARGNRQWPTRHQLCSGPIPARAGQPTSPTPSACAIGAYPRSRGATHKPAVDKAWGQGLSPLARGNLRKHRTTARTRGPIPARAGQPRSLRGSIPCARAYPRSRGATDTADAARLRPYGLSPLARGNLRAALVQAAQTGPIPARAGQPAL